MGDPTDHAKNPAPQPRQSANALGLKEIPADFDDADPEIEALFYDGPIFPDD